MRPRSCLPEKERRARSRLTQLVHNEPFIRGCLVLVKRRCGKPRCHCRKPSQKHLCYCLGVKHQGKRKMIYVPGQWQDRIRRWLETHREISQLMEVVTERYIDELIKSKERENP